MGYLAATSAYLIVALAIGFIVMVVGLFVGHVIIFDSIALGIISGVCCNHFFKLHSALCLLIGVIVFALLLFLQKTCFGFGIIIVDVVFDDFPTRQGQHLRKQAFCL